ncbi:hypothetical protein BDV06DRAFT_193197, partial [Aspergillus oleicola]
MNNRVGDVRRLSVHPHRTTDLRAPCADGYARLLLGWFETDSLGLIFIRGSSL